MSLVSNFVLSKDALIVALRPLLTWLTVLFSAFLLALPAVTGLAAPLGAVATVPHLSIPTSQRDAAQGSFSVPINFTSGGAAIVAFFRFFSAAVVVAAVRKLLQLEERDRISHTHTLSLSLSLSHIHTPTHPRSCLCVYV